MYKPSSDESLHIIPGGHVYMSIRPEKIFITKKELTGFSNRLQGEVKNIIYYGQSTQYRVVLGNGMIITVFDQNDQHFPEETIDYDDCINLYFQKENVVLLSR